uniref:Integrase catalytic domain-containing protein n=1 Tax=Tanacetum cinerariifolium TaxID=118510 RepID=A0A699GPF8_TANCI|nr:hypothetical protein [Tanacetum cinerariifolium]
MNKLVKENLVRGLPSKLFENDQTCVACQKEKQHRASCKSKIENSTSLPLHLLHMDLFGLIFVKSLMKKMYCLVVTDDYSRFRWVLFLATKDETSGILKSFITRIENLVDHKVKVIRCNNRAEFKNREMNQFCEMKEAVNTACYVQNRVLVVKPHNKTPYELFHGRTPTLNFMRQFGCPDTVLNTIDHLGKFNGKADECFFVRYSLNSKAFRVSNSRTRIVEEKLHIRFSESTPNVVGSRPDWLFDINTLARTMNYELIVAGTQSNGFAGIKASDNAGQARKETEPVKDYILLPLWTADPPFSQDPKSSHNDGFKPSSDGGKKVDDDPCKKMNVMIKKRKIMLTALTMLILFIEVKTASTAMETQKPLFKDEVCACTRYQVNPNVSHLHAVKRIFRYLKGQPKLGLRYPKDSPVDLVAYTDSDYAGASLDRKSTTGGKAKKNVRLMMEKLFELELKLILLFWSTAMAKTINRETQLNARVDGKKIIITEASIKKDLQLADEEGDCLPNSTIFEQLALMRKVAQVPQPSDPIEHVADEAIHKELGDSLVRAATTASSLGAEQDSGNIAKTQSKETPIKSSSQGTDSGGGPRCQEAMGDSIAQTRFESVSKHSNDSLLAREQEVVKDVNVNIVEEVVNAAQDSTATTTITTEETTLAQALEALKTSKPKVKGIVIQEQEEPEDEVWKKQQGYKVLEWKLYDSSGVSVACEHQENILSSYYCWILYDHKDHRASFQSSKSLGL